MIATAAYILATHYETVNDDIENPATYLITWIVLLALFMWFDLKMVNAL
jgi:hypothetical protein